MRETMLEDILRSGFFELGLELDGRAAERYRIYYENLEETNKVMNLTAISGEADVARLHFLDCAALLGMQDFAGSRVIDVGTGAGFPGLALKIACPDMQLTLLDSLDKRIGFLRGTCAVARLNLLCELCLPYVKRGGAFIAMKGPELDAELKEAANAIRLLGGSVEKRTDYRIPGTDIVHSSVIIRKVSDTPAKYPRRWAQIKKAAL